MKCDRCGLDNLEESDGLVVLMPNSLKRKYFICGSCLNTKKMIEDLILEVDNKKSKVKSKGEIDEKTR